MLSNIPSAKIKSSFKKRLDSTSISTLQAVAWINYQMFLKKLSAQAAENAKKDKSAVIREYHVKDAARKILRSSKG